MLSHDLQPYMNWCEVALLHPNPEAVTGISIRYQDILPPRKTKQTSPY